MSIMSEASDKSSDTDVLIDRSLHRSPNFCPPDVYRIRCPSLEKARHVYMCQCTSLELEVI